MVEAVEPERFCKCQPLDDDYRTCTRLKTTYHEIGRRSRRVAHETDRAGIALFLVLQRDQWTMAGALLIDLTFGLSLLRMLSIEKIPRSRFCLSLRIFTSGGLQ